MSGKDLFDKPFDDGTKTKLEIFEKYFEAWLPTFILTKYTKPIQVFDLFAGNGYDKNGVPGSPIRALEVIKKHYTLLKNNNKKVVLYFNDIDSDKIANLQTNVTDKIKELGISDVVEVNFTKISFTDCLSHYKKNLPNGYNLIFIDQNGFKEVTEHIFGYLINLETTEFMFFISSTFLHRFPDEPEVIKHHPKFDFPKIKHSNRKKVHKVICEEFEKYVPKNIASYGLLPFSIMKNDNINVYGLIFVTKHVLGADKFLKAVWKENALNGNANFDIDDEMGTRQGDFFEDQKPTKIVSFQNGLREQILSGNLKNNLDAYLYTINQGHLPKHAHDEIKKMRKERLISFENPSPLVNYNKVIKESVLLEYKVLKQ